MHTIATPNGPARVRLHPAENARALLALGHGAGGGIDAPDLLAARDAALAENVSVALVEQPYRVAGRKSSPPPKTLDTGWLAVMEELRGELPLIAGGRSAGARVACRTAAATEAVAVLCLAFPFQPPARKGKLPGPDRLGELQQVEVPMLIVQGDRDQFGTPPEGPWQLATVTGNHSLKSDLAAVAAAVGGWLKAL